MLRGVGEKVRNYTFIRHLYTTSKMKYAANDKDFENAQQKLKTLKEDPGNETKLKIYGLFKQATSGENTSKRPSMMDFVGRAKWDAWKNCSELTKDEAQTRYINLVGELTKSEETSAMSSSEKVKTLKLQSKGGMSIIQFNRPEKKNAISIEMYNEIADALHTAGKDQNTRITVVTGSGDFYSSGNDLANFMGVDPSGMEKMAKDAGVLLERFVSSFIDHPKPLIALVNGPAIGVAVTTLGLFDVVYASDRATFHTPFSSLGQSPEGCSSIIFPRLMGTGKACEMMLFGKKLSAFEAKEANLVTEVFPHHSFESESWDRMSKFANFPKNSLRLSKLLIRGVDKESLHEANKQECQLLVERWQSDECVQAIMNFFQQKSKM